MKRNFVVILLTFIAIILAGCQKDEYIARKYYLNNAFSIMPQVMIVDKESKIKKYEENNLAKELSAITDELDDTFNIFEDRGDENPIKKINNNSGIAPVKVSDEVIEVIKTAIYVTNLSYQEEKALYDITILPVWELWGFRDESYGKVRDIPTPEEIEGKLDLIDYKKIIIDEENNTVFLAEEGMKIDLGSIVKGYATDKIKEYLLSKNIENAIIDVGGNIMTMGYNYYNDAPWTVRIKTPYITYDVTDPYYDPNYNLNYYVGTLYYTDITAVTSGVYERYIVNEGKEYHHIINPSTGYPIDNDLISTTILTKDSMMADAISTTAFSLGLEEGYELVESLDSFEAIFITKDLEVYVTSGLIDEFIFNTNLEKINYTYKGVKNGTNN